MSFLRLAARSTIIPRAAFVAPRIQRQIPFRGFAAAAGLSKQDIEARVLDVLKGFEKVDAGKLSTSSHFSKDLGLDSLDAVEVVMAVEEEFAIEIPDAEADEIQTVQQAIEYIAKTPEGPLYDVENSVLHFVDILEHKVRVALQHFQRTFTVLDAN
ncbi:mitochondrial acyl carrier protein [Marasmius crinis-equi]|uniref:Acyl carrier protein n=1 Tax=Marasmius crinis-equi TaxID=585013 RepID=A0ABR3FUF8_9AGAR